MPSYEEKVEDYFKDILKNTGQRIYGKTESMSAEIETALKSELSKSGGTGGNRPDIQVMLRNKSGRRVPVMIECKGTKGRLEKRDSKGSIVEVVVKAKGNDYSAIRNYAVNGALHYGRAALRSQSFSEAVIIGVNGTTCDASGRLVDPEFKAYYLSRKNSYYPKQIDFLDDQWSLFKPSAADELFRRLDDLNLTDEERRSAKEHAEADLDTRIQRIHQAIYEDPRLKTPLGTNQKLYLFCGLIMAGLHMKGRVEGPDLSLNEYADDNDSVTLMTRIKSFLRNNMQDAERANMIADLLEPVFRIPALWRKQDNGDPSLVHDLYFQIKDEIIPILDSNLHLDFAGRILNKLSDWVTIENDKANDVVLTPRYITYFMARLAKTNCDSYVWDRAMGSAGFLVAALEIMIKDAEEKIKDPEKLATKIDKIKREQILGIEILGNIYILAALNMILMGNNSSNIINGDSHKYNGNFPANVFLLNPPYSAEGKGLIFAAEAMAAMVNGRACVLIQENAGSGQATDFARAILARNTLLASIHMPIDLFSGKASVQTAIYVFEVGVPHDIKNDVIFIDMSEDGYTRQNRKKSSQDVNLRDDGTARARYTEVEDIIVHNDHNPKFYTRENGKLIYDKITLSGNDWTFNQHRIIDTTPTEEDFKKTVSDYLAWKVSIILKGQVSDDV